MVSESSSNLTLVSSIILEGTGENRTISLTPTSNENGTATISLSVTDGELTATTSFALTVNAVNDSPIISSIANQTIDEDSSLTQISFTVSDIDSLNLMVSACSSNPTLVNNTSIIITGDMLSLTPTANEKWCGNYQPFSDRW
ncbi:MAG: hypothetical protein OMM_06151 [Candidatus Magnetoglobus multicellularis str. Araruama]|uniref:Cadherin domain-containing protein n=1 Tax=Candidatus Magnetoglobus multicellularis str. Araruama TaxID=890399 RepID=A0A1V1NQY8_9BACT|nr:MAG: hypothetical protein OMM_06151 [Candidatus Magnetoglobus multicellularis str. Araruama]